MVRDMVDRSLVDLLSFYRDLLVVGTGAQVELINVDQRERLTGLSTDLPAESVVTAMDAIGTARARIDAAVPPLLALEAMMISLIVS